MPQLLLVSVLQFPAPEELLTKSFADGLYAKDQTSDLSTVRPQPIRLDDGTLFKALVRKAQAKHTLV
ncbi:hypothetical protein HQ563_03320 [bacterium]|nr:hypothetical protein [bacterium]